MPISVVLTDEFDKELERLDDVTNILHRLLPSDDDSSYNYLRFIDWYGDTVFNRLQIESFLDEWSRLERTALIPEDKELVGRVTHLALRCRDEPHLYLKFSGD